MLQALLHVFRIYNLTDSTHPWLAQDTDVCGEVVGGREYLLSGADGAGNDAAALEDASAGVAPSGGEQSFMCTVCRKVFKREMNLIFHMTTHRPRQPQLESTDAAMAQPVKCQDCGKVCASQLAARDVPIRLGSYIELLVYACPLRNSLQSIKPKSTTFVGTSRERSPLPVGNVTRSNSS